jgi:nicotinamidase-related amidase
VLLIDLQRATGSREFGLGQALRQLGRKSEGEERFTRLEHIVVPALKRLLAGARESSCIVIYAVTGAEKTDASDVVRSLRELVTRTQNFVGHPNHQVLPEVAPERGERVFLKKTMSAFKSTDLERYLKETDVQSVLVAGISTNSCVESTARDAADLGFDVILVEDGCAAATEELHLASVRNFRRFLGSVVTVDEAIAFLASTRIGEAAATARRARGT